MKIIITGCGMLGYDLCRIFNEDELFAIDIKEPNFQFPVSSFHLCDITDFEKTYNTITKINPDIVIHTAAWTDVDGAESKPDAAYRLNVLGTRNIALACQRFDTAMVYISTDYVFDGEKKEPYIEFDKTNPLSIYGKSKYFGEVIIQQLLNKYFIVRSSWLFGKNGKNFVKTVLNLAKEKKEIKIVNDQIGSPTYTKDLAESIKQLITMNYERSTGLYGTYHITNSESCSWYDFAKEIIRQSGVRGPRSEVKIKPITTEELNRPAKRPKASILKNFMWELNGFEPVRSWKEALKSYLEEI
ncbi:MAG: dTDP-4-dehydrorhamnose reductase [Elusimicrobia bacterium]|nr:dTDP-4-dehydrorhamnose reductase [Elusimicrobiota bacterium]